MNQDPTTRVPNHSSNSPDAKHLNSRKPRSPLMSTLITVAAIIIVVVLATIPSWLPLNDTLLVEGMVVAALFALATNFLVHYAGLITFGQAVFYGSGAYTIGLLSEHHVPFIVSFILGPFVGAILAFLVGALSLRTRAFYFALMTFGFSQLFYSLTLVFYNFTQGDTGIFGIHLPAFLSSSVSSYEFILLFGALATLALWCIIRSPFGLSMMAVRDNRRRAQSLGMNAYLHLLAAFVISGFFCGLAGVLFVVYQQHAYPEMLNWQASGTPILMSVLGGLSEFAGPIIGAVIYTILENWLGSITTYWQLVVGVIVLAFILVYPGGIVRGVRELFRKVYPYRNVDTSEANKSNPF